MDTKSHVSTIRREASRNGANASAAVSWWRREWDGVAVANGEHTYHA